MSLSAVVDLLACPVCGEGLAEVDASLRCAEGHAFDVAKQGYVTLSRSAIRHQGDTADMVAARERVQTAGLFDGVTAAVVDAVGVTANAVLDVGAGTAHHTAAVVAAAPGRRAVAVDSSKAALRRAGRAHDRVGAVGADLVDGLPVRGGVIDVLLVTFAPRNVEAFDRVLSPGGRIVVVTPGPGHLAEIAGPMGLLEIGEDKAQRLAAGLAPTFTVASTRAVSAPVRLDRGLAADIALMGPAAFHASVEQIHDRASALPPESTATVEVTVTTFVRP